MESRTAKKLSTFLEHAVKTTPFYKPFGFKTELDHFPVLTKSILKVHYNNFISNAFNPDQLKKTSTSGSTGTPFVFYITPNKLWRRTAEMLFYNQIAGYLPGMPFAQVRTDKFSSFYKYVHNAVILDPSFIDQQWLKEKRDLLSTQRTEFLVGWPSVLSQIASYCQSKGDNQETFHLKGIVTSAEPLTRQLRDQISSVLCRNLYDRYATQELGVVAHECKICNSYHLNTASHYFEFLKLDSNEPADLNESARLIVTDLYSHAMPLIRYEIGDIVIRNIQTDKCPGALKVKSIQGRVNDVIYNPNGTIVNWAVIEDILKTADNFISDVSQYQFVQESIDQYSLKLISKNHRSSKTDLKNKLVQLLGLQAKASIEFVQTIPKLPSGKCPVVLNQMTRNKV